VRLKGQCSIQTVTSPKPWFSNDEVSANILLAL
jgi:hypothetical protein